MEFQNSFETNMVPPNIPHEIWGKWIGIYLLSSKPFQENRRALPFDIRYNSDTMDLLTDQGFANAVFHTLCIAPGGSATTAPVCSTFVLMQLGTKIVFISQSSSKVTSKSKDTLLCIYLCMKSTSTQNQRI